MWCVSENIFPLEIWSCQFNLIAFCNHIPIEWQQKALNQNRQCVKARAEMTQDCKVMSPWSPYWPPDVRSTRTLAPKPRIDNIQLQCVSPITTSSEARCWCTEGLIENVLYTDTHSVLRCVCVLSTDRIKCFRRHSERIYWITWWWLTFRK